MKIYYFLRFPFLSSTASNSSCYELINEFIIKHSKILHLILILTFSTYQLRGQVPDSIPTPVLEFYGDSEFSNQSNEQAPSETHQFGQLAGIWYCTGFQLDPLGKVDKVPYKAYWAWKYILNGYGVQDYFYQGRNEFRYWDYFKRDLSLTQLRVYDTIESLWKIAFIKDSAGKIPGKMFGTFTAKMLGDELIMEPGSQNTDTKNRIVFYDISENSFEWKAEKSDDSGKTWTVSMSLSAKRVK